MKFTHVSLSLLGIAMSGALFLTACQKDELVKPQGNQTIDNRTNVAPVITYSPNPGIVGEPVTVSLEYGSCGGGQLQRWDPTLMTWVQVVGNTPASASVPDITYSFTPTTPGACAEMFRAVTNGPGGPAGCNSTNGSHPGVCLEVIQPCAIDTGDYVTFSQGYYLQSPNGEDFLLANPQLGPVNVGCEAGTMTSYTLEQIIAMEPGNSTEPGILVKQIITMTLNIAAQSLWVEDADLGCLVVVADDDEATTLDDAFEGMTVEEILIEANNVAGGCQSAFSAGQLTGILAAIVSNFHEGEVNQGLLTCCE